MIRLLLLILLNLALSPILAAAPPHYEHLKVHTIDVSVANDSEDHQEKSILARLKTKNGSYFSQEDFDEDLKNLAKEFDRIDPKVEVANDELYITLKVWLKPTIHSIKWQGNTGVHEEKLSKELGIRPGMIFDRQNFNRAFHKLKNFYIKKGYFEAELDYSVHRDSPKNDVDITIHIKEGRCGQIHNIIFHNLTPKEEDDLLELIFTKEYNCFTWLN